MAASMNKTVKMEKCEGGWIFQYAHEWLTYRGVLNMEQGTGTFVWQLLANKPKLLDKTFAAGDYTLTPVGDDIMMHIEFRVLDESIDVLLERVAQTQDVVTRQMAARIAELERRVDEQNAELETLQLPGRKYESAPIVTMEQLMRYATAFSESYQTFLKLQVNTTAAEAFTKWKATQAADAWWLSTEYFARVRNLSMIAAQWGDQASTSGMYVSGCWQVARASWGSAGNLLGPFYYSAGQFQFTSYWISITQLEPISEARKKELDLA